MKTQTIVIRGCKIKVNGSKRFCNPVIEMIKKAEKRLVESEANKNQLAE